MAVFTPARPDAGRFGAADFDAAVFPLATFPLARFAVARPAAAVLATGVLAVGALRVAALGDATDFFAAGFTATFASPRLPGAAALAAGLPPRVLVDREDAAGFAGARLTAAFFAVVFRCMAMR